MVLSLTTEFHRFLSHEVRSATQVVIIVETGGHGAAKNVSAWVLTCRSVLGRHLAASTVSSADKLRIQPPIRRL